MPDLPAAGLNATSPLARLAGMLRNLCWCLVIVFAVICSLQIMQVDLWWHLAEGRHILQTGALPSGPPAAFGFPSQPYFDEYAPYEVVLVVIHRVGGLPSLWILFTTVFLLTVFLPRIRLTPLRHFTGFSILALGFSALLLRDRLEERPEMIGWLLQILLMLWVMDRRLDQAPSSRALAGLFCIFLVWTNTHSTFVIGLVMLGLWLGCEVIRAASRVRWWHLAGRGLTVGLTACLALLINPYGIRRLTFPFIQAADPGSTALSPEMWPITRLDTLSAQCILVAALLLVWALLWRPRLPVWLWLFSGLTLVLAEQHYRFVGLLAVCLLFVSALRDRSPERRTTSPWTDAGRLVAYLFLVFFLLLLNRATFLRTYDEVVGDPHFGGHTRRLAADLADSAQAAGGRPVAVLSGHGEGSYLSFPPDPHFRPLLDSGLSHFSDDTKRYFFFLLHEPAAFRMALRNLRASQVLLSYDFFWANELSRTPGWRLAECSDDSMLWQRTSLTAAQSAMSAPLAAKVARLRDNYARSGENSAAFFISTLVDSPETSFPYLNQITPAEWGDSTFNFASVWMTTVPDSVRKRYLAQTGGEAFTPARALVAFSLGHEALVNVAHNIGSEPRFVHWPLLVTRDDLRRGQREAAMKEFARLSTRQPASVAYFKTRWELDGEAGLDSYGSWQTWNPSAQSFFTQMTSRLNERLSALGLADTTPP